jgi:4-hydroxybenzoate polyprenyltransferase
MPNHGLLAKLRLIAADIKLAHSVFALPFAILGAFLARAATTGWGAFAGMLAIVVLCMVFARTWAMLFNRLADREFDSQNPRTARRLFASGRLSAIEGWAIAGFTALLFVASAGLFGVLCANWWPAVLAVPVLIWIAFYSLTKRFTWLCHVFLGGALAASPIAAAIAVNPVAVGLNPLSGDSAAALLTSPTAPAIFWLAGMVLLWVAGFDVIYALQDVDFDRSRGLSSIPASLGVRPALWISRGLHAAAFACLLLANRGDPRFGWLLGAATVLVAALLIAEHLVLARRGQAGLDMAFFTLNGIVSCLVGLAGSLDVVL